MRFFRRNHRVVIALAACAIAAGCTSEKIEYRSGTNFAAPAAAAKSYLGYYDVANKQTVCGSCHVDYQTRWSQTKHASAWANLEANAGAAGYCEACHSVNNLGNVVTDTAVGYRSTKDARYHDVQCESCHGPGLTHASSPSQGNVPLASILADTNATNGCGECHTGTHEPFVNEWKIANFAGLSHSHIQSAPIDPTRTDVSCRGCHTAQGALARFAPTANYVEQVSNLASVTAANALPIVCAVCHDPHGSPNTHQLRYSVGAANVDENLCVQCHQRNPVPVALSTRNSAHSPEGPTLFGLAGWFPPNWNSADTIIGTHGTPSANPTLCAGCHVQNFTVNQAGTSTFVFQDVGHSFIAAPCVDANGQPTVSQTCAQANKTYRSCVQSGCHASQTAAISAYNTDSLRVQQLLTMANSLIAKETAVKSSECKEAATTTLPAFTTCMGMVFNVSLASAPGAFVHNPFLIEQLLITNINQMESQYGISPSVLYPLTPQFQRPPKSSGFFGRLSK
jgi:predicted CXXCH cytochrome family protein